MGKTVMQELAESLKARAEVLEAKAESDNTNFQVAWADVLKLVAGEFRSISDRVLGQLAARGLQAAPEEPKADG